MLHAPLRLGTRTLGVSVRGALHPFSTPSRFASSSSSSPSSTPSAPTPPTEPLTSPRLKKYAPRLAALSERTGVPLPSLAISFLVLHELTAVVPVIGFYYLLKYLGAGAGVVYWLSNLGAKEGEGQEIGEGGGEGEGEGEGETRWHHKVAGWYDEGARRVERVGRRYGILGYVKGSQVGEPGGGAGGAVADAVGAYVLVKALLPLRLAVSIGAAPAFARFALNPVQRAWRRVVRR